MTAEGTFVESAPTGGSTSRTSHEMRSRSVSLSGTDGEGSFQDAEDGDDQEVREESREGDAPVPVQNDSEGTPHIPTIGALGVDLKSGEANGKFPPSGIAMAGKDEDAVSLREQLVSLRALHDDLIAKSSNWKDELETLRVRVPTLEKELSEAQAAVRDADANVLTLRQRGEESRRAIMRLQDESKRSAEMEKQRKEKENRRNSVIGFGALSGAGGTFDLHGGADGGAAADEKALKASRRTSWMFGNNGQRSPGLLDLGIGPAGGGGGGGGSGHRRGESLSLHRTASSSSDAADPVNAQPPLSGGLKEFRLSTSSQPGGSTGLLSVSPPIGSGPGRDYRRMSSTSLASSSVVEDEEGGSDGTRPSSSRWPTSESLGSRSNASASTTSSPERSRALDLEAERDAHAVSAMTAKEQASTAAAALAESRREVEALRKSLRKMAERLDESEEARSASETCLRALREFIASYDDTKGGNGADGGAAVGKADGRVELSDAVRGMSLPPLPTDLDEEEKAEKQRLQSTTTTTTTRRGSGWKFSLPSLGGSLSTSASPSDSSKTAGGVDEGFGGASTSSAGASSPASATTPTMSSRFWARRSSTASTGSSAGGVGSATTKVVGAAMLPVTSGGGAERPSGIISEGGEGAAQANANGGGTPPGGQQGPGPETPTKGMRGLRGFSFSSLIGRKTGGAAVDEMEEDERAEGEEKGKGEEGEGEEKVVKEGEDNVVKEVEEEGVAWTPIGTPTTPRAKPGPPPAAPPRPARDVRPPPAATTGSMEETEKQEGEGGGASCEGRQDEVQASGEEGVAEPAVSDTPVAAGV